MENNFFNKNVDETEEKGGPDFEYSDSKNISSYENEKIGRKQASFKEKAVFGLILFISVVAMALAINGYAKNIKEPFQNNLGAGNEALILEDNLSLAAADLANKDTDEDGLSDYDELYTYNTSPYIGDTDSDGYSDKDEIDAGYDPNCPAGKNCEPNAPVAETSDIASTAPVDLLPDIDANASDLLSGQMNPVELRSLLLQMGIPQNQLDAMDDATLLQVYKETLQQLKKDTASGNNPYETPAPTADLPNYTPAQIRQILIQEGMPETDVNSLTDEEIQQIYNEALKNLNSAN